MIIYVQHSVLKCLTGAKLGGERLLSLSKSVHTHFLKEISFDKILQQRLSQSLQAQQLS